MVDREKVIKALECCQMVYECKPYEKCPYSNGLECGDCDINRLHYDALALLKEQEAVVPRVSSVEQRCGNCNKVIEMDGWKACPWCGKMIDWERLWNKNGTHDNT